MELSNLSPAKGSVKNRKRIGRGNATGQGELQEKVIKVINPDLVLALGYILKVVKCL